MYRYSEPDAAAPPAKADVEARRALEVRDARNWLFARANDALRCNALDAERERIDERMRSGYRDSRGPRVRDRLSDILEEECQLDCRSC